ncbi:hypothetical protein PVA38_12185 [Streptococcus pneumoniae D39]|nr:hypothetical protein PVA38_12185 [Streptococcus pneumoniae D39]
MYKRQQGTLPKEFQEATQESRERSDPLNSYLLLSGSLTKEKLADKLGDLGYKASADRKICLLYTSDAADEARSVDRGCCRIITKKFTSCLFNNHHSTSATLLMPFFCSSPILLCTLCLYCYYLCLFFILMLRRPP